MTKWVLGHKITPLEATGDFDIVIGESPALTKGPPPHHHNGYHEVFLVIEGEMEFVVNDELKVIRQGESINLPPQMKHTFSNSSNNRCKWINIHSPKGFFSFFENLGIPENEDNAQLKSIGPEVIKEVIETASQYDMMITN